MGALLTSCSQVPIKDELVCADMGSQGATCDYMLHAAPSDIPKSQWDDKRFGQFCISSDAFADFKSEIEKLCSLSGKCTYPANLGRLLQRVKSVKP